MSENTNERWYCNRWNWTVCIVVLAIYGYALFGGSVHQWFYENYWAKPPSGIARNDWGVFTFEYAVLAIGLATVVAASLIRREQYWKWMFGFGWLLIFLQTAGNAQEISCFEWKDILGGLLIWGMVGCPLISFISITMLGLRKMAAILLCGETPWGSNEPVKGTEDRELR